MPMRPWPWMIVASRRPRAESRWACTGAASPGSTLVALVTVGGPPVIASSDARPKTDVGCASRGLGRGGERFLGWLLEPGGHLPVAHDHGPATQERGFLDIRRDDEDGRS